MTSWAVVLLVGARFVGHGGVEHDVGLLGEEGLGIADDGDEFVAEVLDEGNEDFDFGGVAAFGDADHHVGGLDHAEVAMDGVGGVHEEGRGAGAVEGGDHFGGYVGALADAGENDAAGGAKNGFHGCGETVIDVCGKAFDCLFFFCNYFYCNLLYFLWCLQWSFFFAI